MTAIDITPTSIPSSVNRLIILVALCFSPFALRAAEHPNVLLICTDDMIYLEESHMRMIRTDRFKLVLHFDADGSPLQEG